MPQDINIEKEAPSDLLLALGMTQGLSLVLKFGRNPDVDTGASEDIWNGGGLYTGFPTTGSAEPLGVASSSANDTAAGTGAITASANNLDVVAGFDAVLVDLK